MSKILLLSSGLGYLTEFVGKAPESVSIVFIPTAGNPDTDVWWIDKDRDVLAKMGFHFTELDIADKKPEELEGVLDGVDLVYVAGGYTYYLLEQVRNSGFDAVLQGFVDRGGMYVGASAGALVVGPDIEPCASIDDANYGPSLKSSHGLGLVPIVPMPHYSMSERRSGIDTIVEKYKVTYEIVPITDDEAIVSDGTSWRVVESKRSELELQWFERAGLHG